MSNRAGYNRRPEKVSTRAARRAAAFVLCALCLLSPAAGRERAAHYKWTPVPVAHAAPSQLFKQLGLTHITRIGSARKSWEDPGFPKNLTDVVPYDAQHVLLLRGTESGIADYKQTIAAADFAAQNWRLTVELVRVDGSVEKSVAVVSDRTAAIGTPVTVSLGEGADARTYRLAIGVRSESAIQLSCQPCLALPATPAPAVAWSGTAPAGATPAPSGPSAPGGTPTQSGPATTGGTPAHAGSASTGGTPMPPGPDAAPGTPASASAAPTVGVLTPALVFAAVMTRTVKAGEPATFTDPAASRQAALRKLGASATGESVDYRVRITCLPAAGNIESAASGSPPAGPRRPE